MRLHLDDNPRESRLCLAAVIAIMVLTGSAILVMGAHFNLPSKTMSRVVLATPF